MLWYPCRLFCCRTFWKGVSGLNLVVLSENSLSCLRLWVVRLHFFLSIACLPLVFFLPETYSPKILAKRAAKFRKEGKENAYAAHELHSKSTIQLLQGHVFRPLGMQYVLFPKLYTDVIPAMILHEPIVQGAGIWISLAYGII